MKIHTPGLPSRYTDGDGPTPGEPANRMSIPPAERRHLNRNPNMVDTNNPQQVLRVNTPMAHAAAANKDVTARQIKAAIEEARSRGVSEKTPNDAINPATGKQYPIAPPTGEPSVLLRDNPAHLPAMAGFKEQHDALIDAVAHRPAGTEAQGFAYNVATSQPLDESVIPTEFSSVSHARKVLGYYKSNPDKLDATQPTPKDSKPAVREANSPGVPKFVRPQTTESPSITAKEYTKPDLVAESNATAALDNANAAAPVPQGQSSADLAAALAQASE